MPEQKSMKKNWDNRSSLKQRISSEGGTVICNIYNLVPTVCLPSALLLQQKNKGLPHVHRGEFKPNLIHLSLKQGWFLFHQWLHICFLSLTFFRSVKTSLQNVPIKTNTLIFALYQGTILHLTELSCSKLA